LKADQYQSCRRHIKGNRKQTKKSKIARKKKNEEEEARGGNDPNNREKKEARPSRFSGGRERGGP